MLATALIVFREVLEAALIVGIVMAASKGVPRRGRWVAAGIGGGLAGALLVAGFAKEITDALAGIGQELFDAGVLFAAVLMLGWHNVWMGSHGRELAVNAGNLGKTVLSGGRPLYALAIAVGLAVLREGSETVLILSGMIAGQGVESVALGAGGALGIAAGCGVGAALYFGLLRIPLRHLFTVTGWMILLIAAGMAAQAAAFLVQADLLPPLGSALWDTSFVLRENSVLGRVLHVLIGYVARPDGIQIIFYLVTLSVIGALMLWAGRGDGAAKPRAGRPEPHPAE